MSRLFLVQLPQGDEFTLALAATPYEITHNEDIAEPIVKPVRVMVRDPFGDVHWEERRDERTHAPCPIPIRLTLLTSMFLHGSWMHLLGTCFTSGSSVTTSRRSWDRYVYLIVYLACGLVGSLAQMLVNPDSITPTLGASGAIAGIMGAYVIWFPHNQIRVLLFRFITVLPAILVIGAWIALQIYLGTDALRHVGDDAGGVAYLAHVGRCPDRHRRGVSVQGQGQLRQGTQLGHGGVVGV